MNLSIKNLTKSFNLKPVINNLNLEVQPKSTIGITGENGSGKTTLLKIISGIMKPDHGSGSISEYVLFSSNYDYLKKIFYWGHSQDCYSYLTPLENLKLFLQLRSEFIDDELIKYALKNVGLEVSIHQSLIEFSAGMIQRYHIARMKLSNWEILILDEPTNALDKKGLAILEDCLVKYKDEKTIIISSHNNNFLTKYCDTVYNLSFGKLEQF